MCDNFSYVLVKRIVFDVVMITVLIEVTIGLTGCVGMGTWAESVTMWVELSIDVMDDTLTAVIVRVGVGMVTGGLNVNMLSGVMTALDSMIMSSWLE